MDLSLMVSPDSSSTNKKTSGNWTTAECLLTTCACYPETPIWCIAEIKNTTTVRQYERVPSLAEHKQPTKNEPILDTISKQTIGGRETNQLQIKQASASEFIKVFKKRIRNKKAIKHTIATAAKS